MKDVLELNTPIVFDNSVEVYDIMRFFKGDVNLSQASKEVEITFVGFVEFQTRGQPTMHMLHIEIIFSG